MCRVEYEPKIHSKTLVHLVVIVAMGIQSLICAVVTTLMLCHPLVSITPPHPPLVDSNGVCVAAVSRRCEDVFTPIQIEALAAREGFVLAVHRGFHGISLESDSLQIVLALHGSSMDVSPIGPSIEDAN
ncbi:unnamed protein product [Malus baccata var. baccata]